LDQQINATLGEMQKLDSSRAGTRDAYEQMKLDVHALQSELDSQRDILEEKVSFYFHLFFVLSFFIFPHFSLFSFVLA
jgi:hypothetical protein